MKPPCHGAALDYLARGWSVIPLCPPDHVGVGKEHAQKCNHPGKVPLGPWAERQKTLPRQADIDTQFNHQPNANVGIVLGTVSGLIGLDIDGEDGEKSLSALSCNDLPATLEFTTPGGGRRILYKAPPDEPIPATVLALASGGELRCLASGTQTVMPPSRHVNGKLYEWRSDRSPYERNPAPTPQWLINCLRSKPPKPGQGVVVGAETDAIPDGQRDTTLTSMAGAMRRRGISEAGIYAALVIENKRCNPPLEDFDLKRIAHSVSKYAPHQINAQTMAKAAKTINLSTVQVEDVAWLWKGWIPLGKVTVLDGDPGLGKSTMLLDLAARATNGWGMPGEGDTGFQTSVCLMSAEDALEDTIKPRLIAAGAIADKIHALESLEEEGVERPYEIPKDLPLIESEMEKVKAKLIIIDPMMAYLSGVDSCKDQDIRKVMFLFHKMAKRNGYAIILLRHLNKGSGAKALYRGGASIGIIGAARSGMLVAEDPDSKQHRVLASTKSNLAQQPESLRFTLQPTPQGVCHVAWDGVSPHSANDLVAPPESDDDKGAVAHAKDVLTAILENGPKQANLCAKEGAEAGVSKRTLERAKKALGVKSHKEITEAGPKWFWKLP